MPRNRIQSQSFSVSADRYPRSYRKYWHELRASQQSVSDFRGLGLKLCRTCRLASSDKLGDLEKLATKPFATACSRSQQIDPHLTLLTRGLSARTGLFSGSGGASGRISLTGRVLTTGRTVATRSFGISGQRRCENPDHRKVEEHPSNPQFRFKEAR